jgi:hypothetical protein
MSLVRKVLKSSKGFTGLETAIVLSAFVVVCSVIVFGAVITSGMLSSGKEVAAKEWSEDVWIYCPEEERHWQLLGMVEIAENGEDAPVLSLIVEADFPQECLSVAQESFQFPLN